MEFNVTVEYPGGPGGPVGRGPDNLFDGDVLEFDHSIFKGANRINHPTSDSTPQR